MLKNPKSFAAFLASALLCLFCTSCGDSHDKVTKDSIDLMNEMAETIEGMKDESSKKKGEETLKKLEKEFEKIKERQDALGAPDTEVAKALKEKYGEKMAEAGQRLTKAMFQDALDGGFQKLMEGFKPSLK